MLPVSILGACSNNCSGPIDIEPGPIAIGLFLLLLVVGIIWQAYDKYKSGDNSEAIGELAPLIFVMLVALVALIFYLIK